jgi:hypothetical protein
VQRIAFCHFTGIDSDCGLWAVARWGACRPLSVWAAQEPTAGGRTPPRQALTCCWNWTTHTACQTWKGGWGWAGRVRNDANHLS